MWQKLSRREQVLLTALGAILVLFLYWTYLLQPQVNACDMTMKELAAADERLKNGKSIVDSLGREELAEKVVEKQFTAVWPKFNTEMQDGAILVDIGLEAVKQGVDVTLVRPAQVVDKNYYLELPFEFTVRGDYLKVMEFIKKMENLTNISEIRKLEIEAQLLAEDEGASPLAADGRVVANFVPVIYTARTPEKRMQLEALARWAVGRYNAYEAQGTKSPYPGVELAPSGPFVGPGAETEPGTEPDTDQGTGLETPDIGAETEPEVGTVFPGVEQDMDTGIEYME